MGSRARRSTQVKVEPAEQDALDCLSREGVAVLPKRVPAGEIDRMRSEAASVLRKLHGVTFDPGSGHFDFSELVTRSERGHGDPAKNYQLSAFGHDLGPESAIARHVVSDRVMGLASAYFGFNVCLTSIAIWLNRPTEELDVERRAQRWHWDKHDFRILKYYVYLDECQVENGPFSYLPGTQYGGRRRSLVGRLPQFTSSEERAARVSRDRWCEVTGPPGTAFLSEVSGLHRGGLTGSGHRLLVAAEFSHLRPWVKSRWHDEIVSRGILAKWRPDLDEVGFLK